MDSVKHAPLKVYDIRNKYKIIDKVGRGTYGTVFKVLSLDDHKYYAIKKFENTQAKLQVQGFPLTALREISLLKQLNHPNIINLKQIICSKPNKRNLFRGSTFLVFQYMHHDFSGLFRSKVKFSMSEIKCMMKQLLQGCNFLHKNKIMHRDIKSANILLNDNGVVQLADFGLGRRTRFESVFTYKVVTLWYRAPELLLGCKCYNHKVDVWSIGCVFAQFLLGDVLFKRETQYSIIEKIYQICGDLEQNQYTQEYLRGCVYYHDMKPKKSFKNNLINYIKKQNPNVDDLSLQFLKGLLQLNPYKRFSCEEALNHQFFETYPLPCEPGEIQKLDVEYHEMFRDRSLKIERQKRKESLDWTDEEEQRKKRKIQQNDNNKINQTYKKYSNYQQNENERNQRYEKPYERRPYYPDNRYEQKWYQPIKREYKDRRQLLDRRQNRSNDRRQDQKHKKRYSKSSSSSSSSQSRYSRSRNKRSHDYEENENKKYKSRRTNQREYHEKRYDKERSNGVGYDRETVNDSRYNGRGYERYDKYEDERKIERDSKYHRQRQRQTVSYKDYRERQDNPQRHINISINKYERPDRYPGQQKSYREREESRRPFSRQQRQKQGEQYKQQNYHRSEKFENRSYFNRENKQQSSDIYGNQQSGYRLKEGNQGYRKDVYREYAGRSSNSRKISIEKRQSPSRKSMDFQNY